MSTLVRTGCRRHPNFAYPCASGPGGLAIGPINRSIEEERRVQILVRDNNVEQALRVQGAEKEDAARGRLPRDETPRPLRETL